MNNDPKPAVENVKENMKIYPYAAGGYGTSIAQALTVSGELFFASSNDLVTQFSYAEDPGRVVIDFSNSHLWDASTVAALDSVQAKYAVRGIDVELVGLNEASDRIRQRLGGTLGS